MFTIIESLFTDPKGTLIFFLLSFPGRVLALSLHEFAHGWVAYRCGDPTAKMLGRLTVNPLKHLDPLGTLMMLFLGFGWAKPVPVNPRNYRNLRRDDLLVSLAGVTMNLILFCLGNLLRLAIMIVSLRGIGSVTVWRVMGYLYQMVYYFTYTNLALCLFNLLPVPPLDGYHVLNDLLLRRRQLFASPRTAQIASMALFALAMTGWLGKGLGWAIDGIMTGVNQLLNAALTSLGLPG